MHLTRHLVPNAVVVLGQRRATTELVAQKLKTGRIRGGQLSLRKRLRHSRNARLQIIWDPMDLRSYRLPVLVGLWHKDV